MVQRWNLIPIMYPLIMCSPKKFVGSYTSRRGKKRFWHILSKWTFLERQRQRSLYSQDISGSQAETEKAVHRWRILLIILVICVMSCIWQKAVWKQMWHISCVAVKKVFLQSQGSQVCVICQKPLNISRKMEWKKYVLHLIWTGSITNE